MIIVTGANGQLGRAIVEQLLRRVAAEGIGVSVRNPQTAQAFAKRGVRVRHGDFAEPDSLPHAFEGATQVLLVSSNAAATGGDPLAQHKAAIGAAKAVGARRVVYTSQMAASATSAFPPMLTHATTEEMLRQSGMAWTALRNGFYAASGLTLLGGGLESGLIEAPADGKVAWTAHADLADAAAIILAAEGSFEGPTPPLTAAESLDLADLAAIASELLGRPVSRQTIADDALQARMAARGLPPHVVEIALGLYVASRNGEFSAIDPTLERLLKRKPVAMREILAGKIASKAA